MRNKECELCEGTGWYGDNGPGIRGNSEYVPCEYCNPNSDGGYAVLDGGWRDAQKELPSNSNDVLIFIENNYSGKRTIEIGDYHGSVWWPDKNQKYFKIIAWRPLPDPPAFG